MVVGILATGLIAAVGLSVDVGNLTLQKNKLQKGVDSAAMAVAQDCAAASRPGATAAATARCAAGTGTSTAQTMVNGNIVSATAGGLAGLTPANNVLTATGSKSVPMTFAHAIGVGAKSITASATARWDQVPVSGVTFLPLALSLCDYYRDSAAAFAAGDAAVNKTYRYDFYQSSIPLLGLSLAADSCNTPSGTVSMNKGAVWLPGLFESLPNIAGLVKQDGDCSFSTNIIHNVSGLVSALGVLFPSDCHAKVLTLVKGNTYLFPVYKSNPILGLGVNLSLDVDIVGYAKFKVTGYKVDGSLLGGSLIDNQDSSQPACVKTVLLLGNQCRAIQGHFVTSVKREPGIQYATKSSTNLDLGAVAVKITE